MTRLSNALAVLAAAGLLAAQPALASARVGAATGDGESLTDSPGAGPAIGAIALVALLSLILLINDGSDDDTPTSP